MAFVFALALTSVSVAGPAPKIKFEEYEWDFGDMYQQEEKTHVFTFTNVGDADLVVSGTKTSCGCTAARLSNSSLSPGQSDKVRLSYDSKKGVVTVKQDITLETNDPARPSVKLPVSGEVRNLFEGGLQIHFNQILADSKQSQSLTLTNNYPRPIHLKLQQPPANGGAGTSNVSGSQYAFMIRCSLSPARRRSPARSPTRPRVWS